MIASSGGRREMLGVFRVKNHDFTPKNHIFPNVELVRYLAMDLLTISRLPEFLKIYSW